MRAGYAGKNLFAPDAIEQIAFVSKGIPRLINIICDNALLAACRAGQKHVALELIQKASCDLRLMETTEPKAAVFSSTVDNDEESDQLSKPSKKDFKAGNPATTDNQTLVDKERQWFFAEFPPGRESKPQQVQRVKKFAGLKIASFLLILILAGSAAVLYFERSQRLGSRNSEIVGVSQQISERTSDKPALESVDEKSLGETSPTQMPASQDLFAAQNTTQVRQKIVHAPRKTDRAALKIDKVGTKVFMHTSKQGDSLVLEEIGDTLRVKGYTIPEMRLSSSRTQGDVRFFFLRTDSMPKG
jgi:hypothetical protein